MIGEKSQAVRLLDVFAVGPLLVYAGARNSTLPTWLRLTLGGIGVATIGYNLTNYVATAAEPVREIDPQELIRGTIHEFEHTRDFDVAKRIALDHLEENPRYYSQMEGCGL